MGWTLGRYFFFRYATITLWFFLGIFALVFLVDFTELTGRIARIDGFSYATAIAISGLPRASSHESSYAFQMSTPWNGNVPSMPIDARCIARTIGNRRPGS